MTMALAFGKLTRPRRKNHKASLKRFIPCLCPSCCKADPTRAALRAEYVKEVRARFYLPGMEE